MEFLHALKNSWTGKEHRKFLANTTSLCIDDRVVSVKAKESNSGELFLVLKRSRMQGVLKDTHRVYKTMIPVNNLLSLELLHRTTFAKDVLKLCGHLHELLITDAHVDSELVRYILQNTLEKSCRFDKCTFDLEALHNFFNSYFQKTLRYNWFAKVHLTPASEAAMERSLTLSDFEVQSLYGQRTRFHFVLEIKDDKRKSVTTLSFQNCSAAKRLTIFKCLRPEPLRALHQVVEDIRHVIRSSTAWDDNVSGWDMSPVECVSNPFNSYRACNRSYDSGIHGHCNIQPSSCSTSY